jgi:hypothetical protein
MSASNADHTPVPGSQIVELLLPAVNLLRLDGIVIDAEDVTIKSSPALRVKSACLTSLVQFQNG